MTLFQLTAARRRLESLKQFLHRNSCFNSQPPEGGWAHGAVDIAHGRKFQLTAARRRLVVSKFFPGAIGLFQLTAARRRLVNPRTYPICIIRFQLTAARRRLVSAISAKPSMK